MLAWLLLPLALAWGGPAAAQEAVPSIDLVNLPAPRHLAASLSDPQSRLDTLMTMVAVARLQVYGHSPVAGQFDGLATRFRDERAWLDHLADRYTHLPVRGSLLDPVAWYLALELDQQNLVPGLMVSPLGPSTEALLSQLFDRSNERLAATLLPEVLSRMELRSTTLWREVLDEAAVNEPFSLLLQVLDADWFELWGAAEPPAPLASDFELTPVENGVILLQRMAANATQAGPPDALALKRLRYSLLSALPDMGAEQRVDAEYLLLLGGAIDALYRREFLGFTETLLWVAAGMLFNQPMAPSYLSPVPKMLAGMLPGLSNAFATEFAAVDPRINSSLASVFDVVQFFQAQQSDAERLTALRRGLANAIAQLVLLIPDMDYYFEQPVREPIDQEVDVCVSIVAASRSENGIAISRDQFDGCLKSLTSRAESLLNSAELSGDPDGPFGMEQLQRELVMTPWQRINFVLGYQHESYPSGCELPQTPLPNPLEWSALATTITWLARQSPVYFQAPENESLLVGLQQQGLAMLESLFQQIDCISGAGSGVNDPVLRGLADYREALANLVGGLREAELEFREERLKPGADVVLGGDASQRTAYRPENMRIGPCQADLVCEMTGELQATRALVGLFPDRYLLADQSGLGQIEICYDNVQWVSRRSEPVRADDPHVANYYGHLSFDLVGRFREGENETRIFGFTFTSPDEYHYLFGAATEEVLQDSCPVEQVGVRITTLLNADTPVRVVPDRLTYLSAARSLPSRIMNNNWDKSQEWRDVFVTGVGVRHHEYAADETIGDRVNRHLQTLYQAEQAALYNALLRPPPREGWRQQESLYSKLADLSARKALVRTQVNLFYPQLLIDSDELRGSLEGYGSLLDDVLVRRFRQSKVPISSINEDGLARLEKMITVWSRQPEAVRRTGNISTSIAHAMARLADLYGEYFAQPALPPGAGEAEFSQAEPSAY